MSPLETLFRVCMIRISPLHIFSIPYPKGGEITYLVHIYVAQTIRRWSILAISAPKWRLLREVIRCCILMIYVL